MAGFAREALRGQNRFLVRIALIAAIGGFLFGFDTGVISGAQLFITRDFRLGTTEQSWLVGALLVGAVAGAAASGWLSDRLGRRPTKIIAGSVYVVGALAGALAPGSIWFIVSRFVLGLAVGTASFVSVEYISEQAPARLRGGVTTFNQVMVTAGIFVAYLVDYLFKGVPGTWRWMVGLAAVPGLALAIGMVTVPESPRWLLAHGREDEARAVLARSRDDDEVRQEVEAVQKVLDQSRGTGLRDLASPRLRRLMLVGLALAVFQQLIGVNTVIYYSATIFQFTGLNADSSILRALFVGSTNLVVTVVAVLLLDRVGRRPLLLIGTTGAVLSLVLLGLFFHLRSLQTGAPWVALVALVAFIASFAIGLGPVFWLMISEIYPLGIRSKAMSVSTVANWSANFLVSYFFLSLTSGIGRAGTFWIYAGLGVIAIVVFAAVVPETKDRSLEEIESELGQPQGQAA